ncbi:MAG: PhnD/SsuA/transferrin family substrate-binding protein [Polyangiaceae bacterium]
MVQTPLPEPPDFRVGIALSEEGRLTLRATVRASGPTRGGLNAFCDALSVTLDTRVSPFLCESYKDLLSELHWGTLALAWLPPMIALKAVGRSGAVPLVAPVRGGSAWYWTSLFCREDSPLQTLDDLKDLRVAWVDPMSSAGYNVIRASLRAQGVNLKTAFSEEHFLGTHDAVARAVIDGEVDVGATYAHFDDAGRVRTAGWGRAAARSLKFAGPIPGDILAASAQLSPDLREQITDSLLGEGHTDVKRAASSLFSATGFERVDLRHLTHLEELVAYVEGD